MGTTFWKNLAVVPTHEREQLGADYDELGHLRAGHQATDAIYVYFRRGGVVEVRPATAVRLTGDTLEVLNGQEVVACYPRERVVEACRQPVELSPFY